MKPAPVWPFSGVRV